MMEKIDKIAMFGPFIGDWKEEITSFRPYIKWIYENIEFEDFYISTHFNRKFLYDFIKEENFIPIYETLTRSESKQKNGIHKDINTKEYSSIIVKNTREIISDRTGYLKKNIFQYSMYYIKSPNIISSLNKDFAKIPFNKIKNRKKIVFIPDNSCSVTILEKIQYHLQKNYPDDFIIIGDKKCHLIDDNIIHQRIDYFENVYKLLIDYISNADLVICPCSHWTLLANQQGKYVLSWGKNISKYKKESIYGLNNDNCIININKSLINKTILKQIDYVIKKLNIL